MPRTASPLARVRGLLTIAPARVDHIPAFRIAVGLAIPMAMLLLTDRIEFAMYVGFGAFTGIYSRYEPTRARFRRQLLAGAMLTVCVTIGAAVAQLAPRMPEALSSWIVIVVGGVLPLSDTARRTHRRDDSARTPRDQPAPRR